MMGQIVPFDRKTPTGLSNLHYITIVMLSTMVICCCARRGPHHPNSAVNRQQREQEHINEHIAYKKQHIEEDLTAHRLSPEAVERMSEEEKNYYYFKLHDLDGNDKLDGLEIYYSTTHHSVSQDDHELHHNNVDSFATPSNDSNDPSELKLLERDEDGELIDKSFNHIIDVLDNFLNIADLNQDGYLNYPEYAAAVKLGNAMADAEL